MQGLKGIVDQLKTNENLIDNDQEYLRDFVKNKQGDFNKAFTIFNKIKLENPQSVLIKIYEKSFTSDCKKIHSKIIYKKDGIKEKQD